MPTTLSQIHQIDVRESVDRNPLRPIQYWIFAVCILVAIMDGFDFSVVGAAGPTLIAQGIVDPRTFGYIVSAGIIGFVPGMVLFGPAADRWGPKRILIIGVAIFALGSLATALSTDLTSLTLGRLITGVGLGGASPCFVSLAADYAPQRLRTTIVTTLWAGVPCGGIFGGVVAARYLQSAGWQAMFFFAAAAPLLAIILLILTVPESLGFMALRGGRDAKIRSILRRITPNDTTIALASFVVPKREAVKISVKSLFADRQARVTLSLWVAFFCALGQTTMLGQYTSVLLRMSGMPVSQVATVFSFFYAGSVIGTIAAGPIMNRSVHTTATVALFFAAAAGSVLFGFMTGGFLLAVVGITIAGFTAAAAIGALVALTAELYPLSIRATGIGWGLAMSRVGGFFGPLLSGQLISWNLAHSAYYSVVGSLAIVGAFAILNIHFGKGAALQAPQSSPLSN